MPLSDYWTRAMFRQVVRRRLMDPNAKFWPDTELNLYLDQWQQNLQDELRLLKYIRNVKTVDWSMPLTNLAPDIQEIEAAYWNNIRLSGRVPNDLDQLLSDWKQRAAEGPSVIYTQDNQSLFLWPRPTVEGLLTLEYYPRLEFGVDSAYSFLAPFTRYSAVNYCLWRAYLRMGPNHDLRRALRYKAKYLRQVQSYRLRISQFFPERSMSLRPATSYEYDILNARSKGSADMPVVLAQFTHEQPLGDIDGENGIFTLSVSPSELLLYVNGALMAKDLDYTLSGYTITFSPTSIPPVNSVIRAYLYRS